MRRVLKLYTENSVSVCGKKGRGKDILQANVIARRKCKYYISNIDYKVKGSNWINLNLKKLRVGNTYDDFLSQPKLYIYPYPDGTDIYLSDCGVYFPAQYCNELNRRYADIPVFMALSRQLGKCAVHQNAQALNRVWDKIREQSDTYITCLWCKVICGFVFQKIRVHEKYESALSNQPPYRVKVPLMARKEARAQYQIAREQYYCTHGKIKDMFLIYRNKSKYDTRAFKEILENGIEER